ncbi:DUF6489 family protein [Amphiplicatus metriothermophilus]|uniref:Uncharacterized protein n=1 Tax=Amphiplicatus metriothermophilus TaxID=1519374 RepID=A0A239PKY8_9PROT|nr:DUF6489 family protein [Amphiplicatus metriothermophilus]MBB5517663.1 hypothetical protein [Amphiplicatus metriothermophilus]SNT68003.1 hypothetical protein SAMN06297382_0499 [Amphiplicatus metriothermophilus]
MRLTIDIDCTPEEARAFFGMPNVEPLNKMIVDEMTRRAKENLDTLADPERFFAQMAAMSGKGFEQFQNLMAATMGGASGGAKRK